MLWVSGHADIIARTVYSYGLLQFCVWIQTNAGTIGDDTLKIISIVFPDVTGLRIVCRSMVIRS